MDFPTSSFLWPWRLWVQVSEWKWQSGWVAAGGDRGSGGGGRKVTADLREGRRSRISNAQACQDLGFKGENYNLMRIDHWNVLKVATNIDIVTKIEKETVIYSAFNSERSRNSFSSSSSGRSRFPGVQDESHFWIICRESSPSSSLVWERF